MSAEKGRAASVRAEKGRGTAVRCPRASERRFHVAALCRGEGVGYLVLTSDVASVRTIAARGQEAAPVPCSWFAVDDPAQRELLVPKAASASTRVWVVAVPLLSCDCTLTVVNEDADVEDVVFPRLHSKFASRLLTRLRPQAAALLRGYEGLYGQGRTQVRIVEPWPGYGDTAVWRIQVTYPVEDAGLAPWLRAFGPDARELPAPCILMEDHVVPARRDPALFERIATFSCTLPAGLGSFYVRAGVDDADGATVAEGFAGMNAPRAAAMLDGVRHRIAGAPADGRYERWFEEHRVKPAELARQRAACAAGSADSPVASGSPVRLAAGPAASPAASNSLASQTANPTKTNPCQKPLISVVMPVFNPRPEFLCDAVASLLRQSWDAWELVAVNASGTNPKVDAVLAEAADDRVRVIRVPNASIAENTNEGIAVARGDYVAFLDHDDVLEPDALWCLVQHIRQHPAADLLYTDEDRLADGHVHAPAFKTFPNYGKLYCHNYVTHFMAVSRRVLELTERSGADVAGAQDYDLALKAFEVAREVVHIPRVLYHWREHEGSTAGGGNQKPFAHEAGRTALARHLERRGLAAQVEDGPLVYTYRVRFSLPVPAPKVSVVIPTRDHADLLTTCVRSILEKSTYPDLEVVLVENYSSDPEAFSLYERLTAEDARVRVVTWTAPAGEEGAFNYSALVNYGVAHSSGAYVVLLNNDTEVIEAGWVEELLGCLMRPEVGVAGAKLLFGDGLIQHVGMVANPAADNCHVLQNLTKDEPGPGFAAVMPGDFAMVTGACQMVSRSLFDELGGYDERLAVGFNDSDFCLRAYEAGYVSTVATYALLHHREFSSRGREAFDVRLRERFLAEKAYYQSKHAAFFAAGDPALNPNVDPWSAYFELGV